MLSFSTTICTLDNMTPEWKRLSGSKIGIVEDYYEKAKAGIPREEYKKKLYKAVRITGDGVDITVESVNAAAKWLGVLQPNVSKAIKEGYRITRTEDGRKYKVGKV